MPHGHFTHIIIDEAGESTAAESWIPIQMSGTSRPCILLAGDPKQLGPVVRSSVAQQYGLSVSLIRTVNYNQRKGTPKVYHSAGTELKSSQ